MRILIATALLCASLLTQSCAFFDSPERTVKTIADITAVLCDVFAVEHTDQLDGLSPAMFCADPANLAAFRGPAEMALSSGGEMALKRGNP